MSKHNKSISHRINKTLTRNGDSEKLDYLQKNISLPTIREYPLHNEKYTQAHKTRIPDLIINKQVILEHDTFKIHGELNSPNERTLKRNTDHALGDLPFCIIHQDLASLLGLNEAKLATYLYYHTLMQKQAYDSARLIR